MTARLAAPEDTVIVQSGCRPFECVISHCEGALRLELAHLTPDHCRFIPALAGNTLSVRR